MVLVPMEDSKTLPVSSNSQEKANYRQIFLVVYPNRLFKAHWSLMIPHGANSARSTRIHATGDVLNGFRHEIERGYVVGEDDRHPKIIELGQILESEVVVDPSRTGIDTIPVNRLEELALGIPAPEPSLRSINSHSEEHGRYARADRKDCQSWIRDVIQTLAEHNVLDSGALEIANSAPQH